MRDHVFNLRPSIYGRVILFVILITSLTLILFLPLNLIYRLILLILLGAYGIYIAKRLGISANAKSRLSYRQDGTWVWQSGNQTIVGKMRGDSTTTAWVMILRLQAKERRFPINCFIFRDSLEDASYRQLLMLL